MRPSVADWTVLLVDDELDILDSFSILVSLSYPDIKVLEASSGQEALAILERQHVDVVVSDFRMPGMDGLELLERVRDGWPDTARVILSAYRKDGIAQMEAFNTIVDAYLSKSEAPQNMLEALGRFKDGVTA